MSNFVAALPMYDWPEVRTEVDAEWARLRELLRQKGVDAPERLARRNADLPPVPGGIRDAAGKLIAPDPADLPPDEFDYSTLWRHPRLLLAQTCWGPLELGLSDSVHVVGQPDYSAYEGGQGECYSSAIVMRVLPSPLWRGSTRSVGVGAQHRAYPAPPPPGPPDHPPRYGEGNAPTFEGALVIPLDLLAGARLAFNSPDSMSGIIALGRDLETMGTGLEIFSERIETGSHRASVLTVAEGRADVCAIDCRSWAMIGRHQPDLAAKVHVVGWTGLRKGLPLVAAAGLPAPLLEVLRSVLAPSSAAQAGRAAGPGNRVPAGTLPS